MKTGLLLCCFLALGWALPAGAVTPEDLRGSLGQAPGGHLSMLFEVTFMSIDVATVDAYLPAETAERINALAPEGKIDKDAEKAIQAVLVEADPVVVSMTFARDSGWDKFLKGVKGNWETARKCEAVTEADVEAWQGTLEADFNGLEERGVFKGDAVYYAVNGDAVRTVFFDPEGTALLDFTHESAELAASIRNGYFCRESKFRKKLIKSLVDKD